MAGKNQSTGFGLIEVLIALLVTVTGILGMAGLHSRSLQYSQLAALHTQGLVLATDILDRIRMNRALALSQDHYRVTVGAQRARSCTEADYPDLCERQSCTPEQLAAYDIRQWTFQLDCQLPGAFGTIIYEQTPAGRVYVVTLRFAQEPAARTGELVLREAL